MRKQLRKNRIKVTKGTLYGPSYPYYANEGTRLWKVLARAIDDLIENNDLTPKTPVRYIVGYLSKEVSAIPGVKIAGRRRIQRRKE